MEKLSSKKVPEYNKNSIYNNSTLETKFDKHGNKFLMYETVKKFYKETIIK